MTAAMGVLKAEMVVVAQLVVVIGVKALQEAAARKVASKAARRAVRKVASKAARRAVRKVASKAAWVAAVRVVVPRVAEMTEGVLEGGTRLCTCPWRHRQTSICYGHRRDGTRICRPLRPGSPARLPPIGMSPTM